MRYSSWRDSKVKLCVSSELAAEGNTTWGNGTLDTQEHMPSRRSLNLFPRVRTLPMHSYCLVTYSLNCSDFPWPS